MQLKWSMKSCSVVTIFKMEMLLIIFLVLSMGGVLTSCQINTQSKTEIVESKQVNSLSESLKVTEGVKKVEIHLNTGDYKSLKNSFTKMTKVAEILDDSAFTGYARLLFPTDLNIREEMNLDDISNSDTYIWYSNIKSDKSVEIMNYLKQEVINNDKVFYQIYSDEEINEDSFTEKYRTVFFSWRKRE